MNPSTFFIPLVAHTGILLNATTLNLITQDGHWEIYLPSLNIHVWGVVILLVGLVCLLPLTFLFLKNLWFQVYSVEVFPIAITRPKQKPFFNFVLVLFPLFILDICFILSYTLFYWKLNTIFQRKFAATSVIKSYLKIWELCLYADCNHFYILWTSK